MPSSIKVDNNEAVLGLGEFKASVQDRTSLLNICGELMRASIARTFRDEGSPAGSWPALAASTLKRKGYTSGHKLLIMSGRLFGSIIYTVADGVLTIGTALVYAAVHQWGSKDWNGGAAGPVTKEQMASVDEHRSSRLTKRTTYARQKRVGKDGRTRTVRVRDQVSVKYSRFGVSAYLRRQNVPQRMFLMFRPEDPARMTAACESFLAGKAGRLGNVVSDAGGVA